MIDDEYGCINIDGIEDGEDNKEGEGYEIDVVVIKLFGEG